MCRNLCQLGLWYKPMTSYIPYQGHSIWLVSAHKNIWRKNNENEQCIAIEGCKVAGVDDIMNVLLADFSRVGKKRDMRFGYSD